MVRVSPTIPVTRMISALDARGLVAVGQTVQLNGGSGKRSPCPLATTNEVPLVAGDGAVATVE
jgi:hypothetical protein